MKYMNICLSQSHLGLIHLSDTMEPLAVGHVKTEEDTLPLEEQHEIVTAWLKANDESFPDDLKNLISDKLNHLRKHLDEHQEQFAVVPVKKEPSKGDLLDRIESLEEQIKELLSGDHLPTHKLLPQEAADVRLTNARAYAQELANTVYAKKNFLEV